MFDLTDLFCGCGGSSEGARNVAGVEVKYALNHWKLAVESHNTNHPNTHHDCADISETHPARYQRTTGLIASPECTNHSLAKGHKRKNLHQQEIFQDKAFDASAVRSRATMWDVPRFAEIHKYEFIVTENVVDVRMWVMYEAWIKAMMSLGYLYKEVFLNAMFAHGDGINGYAPQSRDRIYIVFWKKGNPAPDLDIRPKAPCPRCGTVEAIQTWKPGRRAGKYKTQYTYRCSVCATPVVPFYYAALNAIDTSIPMVRIGDRESLGMKPLVPNTRNRIQFGLDKYGYVPTILDQRNRFERKPGTRLRPASDVLNTQSTQFSSALFSPFLFNMSHTKSTSDPTRGLNEVIPTQTTQESIGFVAPETFITAHRANATPRQLDGIIPTVTSRQNDLSLVSFIPVHHGKSKVISVLFPLTTQSTMRTNSVVVSESLLTMPYHGGSKQANRVIEPITTVPGNDSISLVDARPSIDDCYFRMFQPKETALAQGFPGEYVILGNKSEQQKQIGNANPPPTMELLVSRCVASLQ